jgi:hypothetical protein
MGDAGVADLGPGAPGLGSALWGHGTFVANRAVGRFIGGSW